MEYPYKVIDQVITELKNLLEICIKNNLIGESSYVDGVLNDLKKDFQNLKNSANSPEAKLNNKIEMFEAHYDEKKKQYAFYLKYMAFFSFSNIYISILYITRK